MRAWYATVYPDTTSLQYNTGCMAVAPLSLFDVTQAFLPPLVFSSAFKTRWYMLRRSITQIVLLAVVGVGITTCLTAVCYKVRAFFFCADSCRTTATFQAGSESCHQSATASTSMLHVLILGDVLTCSPKKQQCHVFTTHSPSFGTLSAMPTVWMCGPLIPQTAHLTTTLTVYSTHSSQTIRGQKPC